jgi:hypothetical protein
MGSKIKGLNFKQLCPSLNALHLQPTKTSARPTTANSHTIIHWPKKLRVTIPRHLRELD